MHYLGASRVLSYGFTIVLLGAGCVFAQKGGAGGGAPTGGAPSRGLPSSTLPGNSSTQPTVSSTTPRTQQNQPIFVSGRVQADDGTPVDPNTRIERVCGVAVYLEAHVDSKGRFAFQIGSPTAIDVDASNSYSTTNTNSRSNSTTGDMLSEGMNAPQQTSRNSVLGCELRASLSGFHSDTIELSGHQTMDNPDIGTIVLHRIGKIDGTTTSVTSLEAPKPAKKLYEKSLQLAQKGKFEEAVNALTKATSDYPRYAVAWETLGEIQSKQGQMDQARSDFEAAIKADSHYVNPYEQLAFVFARQQKWQEAADTSSRAISLDPVEFPGAFWCNAVANYNLKHREETQKSVLALLKLDTQHQYPEAEKMMGQLMLEQGKTQEAAAHIKVYLLLAPNAPDAAGVREWLGKVEQASAQTTPPAHQ